MEETWESGEWSPQKHIRHSFDTEKNLENKLLKTWQPVEYEWDISEQILQTFDDEGKLLKKQFLEFDEGQGQMVFIVQELLSYDTLGELAEQSFQMWDTLNNSWMNYYRLLFTYNAQEQLSTEIFQWAGGAQDWYDSQKLEFIYNAQGEVEEEILSYWSVDTWKGIERNIYAYNLEGLLSEKIEQSYNDSIWENYRSTTFSYDDSDRLVEVIEKDWDADLNDWIFYKRILNVFNNEELLEEILIQLWSMIDALWKDTEKTFHFYDVNQNLVLKYIQYKSGVEWKNLDRWFYDYDDEGNLIKEVWQNTENNENEWENVRMKYYQYNDIDNHITEFPFLWHPFELRWTLWSPSRKQFIYNAMDSLIEENKLFRIPSEYGWYNENNCDYFWNTLLVGDEEVPIENVYACQVPNPYPINHPISCNFEIGKTYRAELYELTGKKIWEQQFSGNSFEINEPFPFGIYGLIVWEKGKIVFKEKLVIGAY